MSLTFHYHPLASFCWKVSIALYEMAIPFTPKIVDLGGEASRADFLALWPVGKIPVLRDEAAGRTIPETSIIIEYCERYRGAAPGMLPAEPEANLETRLWDRFFDNYVQVPMQKMVSERLRPAGRTDPHGAEEAHATLETAYAMIDRQLAAHGWATGESFTMADCAAAPALFYAGIVHPFGGHKATAAYFERLYARPSVRRTIDEARPWFKNFPMYEDMPARFR